MGFIKDLFGGPKPPKVPSAQDTASTAAQYNLNALRTNLSANRLNQQTPYASVNYTQSGTDAFGNPTYSVQTQLTPDQQRILDQLENTQIGIGGTAGSLAASLAGTHGAAPDFSDQAGSLTRTMLDRQLGYLNPYYTAQQENLEAQLRNQGLQPGTPAYDRALRTLRQTQNESIGQFLNSAQSLAFNQAVTSYQQPVEMLQRLMGLSQPQGNLGFQNVPGVNMANVDFGGIQNQTQAALNERYKQEAAQHNAFLNAIGSGLSTIMGAPSGSLFGNIGGATAGGLSNLLGLGNASSLWGTRTA